MDFENVQKVYSNIASHFDKTRFSLWPGVVYFLDSLQPKSVVLDIGCGNGKYLSYRKDCTMYACDTCEELTHIAKQRHPHAKVCIANALHLPYENAMFDATYSIAVLHHMSSPKQRNLFLHEMMRVLKPGGKAMITVWSTDACKKTWTPLGSNDYLVPWHNKDGVVFQRYYHLFTYDEITKLMELGEVASYKIQYEKQNWQICFTK